MEDILTKEGLDDHIDDHIDEPQDILEDIVNDKNYDDDNANEVDSFSSEHSISALN